jgi:glycogen operon protein
MDDGTQRDAWYDGLTDRHGLHDLAWLRADGTALTGDEWRQPDARAFGCLIGRPGRAAAPLLMLINGDSAPAPFALPGGVWEVVLDTSQPRGEGAWHGQGGGAFEVPGRSLVVLAAAGHGLTGW